MNHKKENSLVTNIVRVLSANFWVAMIGFIGSFIFPKILSIESYAQYQIFMLYVGYISILHLGFPSGMVINYAGQEYEELDKKQYKSEMKILLLILVFFMAVFGAVFFVTHNRMMGYIALVVLPVGVINSFKSLYQAWSKFKLYSKVSTIIATFIPLIAIIFYLITGALPGDIYVCVYLIIHWIVTMVILWDAFKFTRGVKNDKLLTKYNLGTEKTGLAIVVGNYTNTLFASADKQFVLWFFGTTEFAFYSFGISMLSIMTVFITSIAQTLFPAMAQGKFNDDEYNYLKNLLMVFGSFSGCAYFVISIIVKLFIQKYIGSLEVVGIYFVVFPAMAVINCLYINVYKIKNLMKLYIGTLTGVLMTVVVLNYLFIQMMGKFTAVAVATTITYYIWFLVGFWQFEFLRITPKDILYLLIYTVGFFVITRNINVNDYLGIMIYFIFVCTLAFMFYKKDFIQVLSAVKDKELNSA